MCFSAGASFAGSVAISAVGVTTMRKVRKPTQRLFAGIPLLFGFQQFAEGILWVTLRSSGHDWLQHVAAYIFLITALVIWPVLIPLSMWFMEEAKKRKKILTGLIVTGGIVSLFYAFCLIFYDVTPQIHGFHIKYVDEFPKILVDIAFIFYLASTIVPLFVSSVRRMWMFGILITVSCLVTGIFFVQYMTSIWCFFAALISAVIYFILNESQSAVSSEVWVGGKSS